MFVTSAISPWCAYALQASHQSDIWQLPQDDLNVTSTCYTFSRGPDMLVITTNQGSSKLGSAFKMEAGVTDSGTPPALHCVVVLPETVTLLDNGLTSMSDVLAPNDVSTEAELASCHIQTFWPAYS